MNVTDQLLALLRYAVLPDAPAPQKADLDPQKILKLAKRHGVFLLAFHGLKELGVSCEAGDEAEFQKGLVKTCNQIFEFPRICEEFEKNGVDYLPLKGANLRPIYPHPELREMSDLDILVREGDLSAAEKCMTALGYQNEESCANHTEYLKPPFMVVEIHWELMSPEQELSRHFTDPWGKAISGKEKHRYHYGVNDEFVFLLGHAAKHYYYCGTGIRSVLDLYLFERANLSRLDEEYLQKEFARAELTQFAADIRFLGKRWFECCKQPMTNSAVKMEESILGSALYGMHNEHASIMIKKTMEKGASVKKAKRKYFWRLVFPKRYDMAFMYPILFKTPLPLPFCWLVRGVRILFKNPKSFSEHYQGVMKIDVEE